MCKQVFVWSSIDLDHQNVHFSRTNKHIAWRGDIVPNCSHSYEISSIRRVVSDSCAAGPKTETINVWLINRTDTTLSDNMLQLAGQLLLFNISAMDNQGIICGILSMTFQLDPLGIIVHIFLLWCKSYISYIFLVPMNKLITWKGSRPQDDCINLITCRTLEET